MRHVSDLVIRQYLDSIRNLNRIFENGKAPRDFVSYERVDVHKVQWRFKENNRRLLFNVNYNTQDEEFSLDGWEFEAKVLKPTPWSLDSAWRAVYIEDVMDNKYWMLLEVSKEVWEETD